MLLKSTKFSTLKIKDSEILNYPFFHSSKDFLTSLKTKQIKELTLESIEKQKVFKTPSVTKILKETMPEDSKQRLEAWENKMILELGQEGFKEYMEDILLTLAEPSIKH